MATPQLGPTPLLDVLLVEDNPADVRLLRAQLEDADGAFSLRHVERLEAAEAVCRRTRFDVCLLDLNLPDSSGVGTVERFRRSVPDLPVVVLTGLQESEAASAAIRAGADEYLVKGQITPRAVERTLRFAVERDRAHRERQAAEERWAVVFEASPVPKVISDAGTGRLLEVNRAFVDMFGYSRRGLLGSTSLELGQWEDAGRRTELVEKARSEGFFEGEEAWFRDADGRRGRMLLACRHLAFSEGDLLLWTVQDITDRVEREQALEARSRALRERVKEQSCLYDISRLLHEDERPLKERLQSVVERLPAGWQHPDVTVARLRLHGDVHVAGGFAEGLPALEAAIEVDGEPVGELAVAYREERPEEDVGPFLAEERRLLDEIAEQIETEVSRQKTRREMGHVVETMNEAVTIAAPDGTVTFANTAARRLFSPGEGDYVGRDLTDFAPQVETLDGEPYPAEELPFQTVMRTGRPVTGFQHAIERADGDRTIVSVNAAPMRDDADEIQGVVLTVRDVTERHREAEWRHLLQSSVEATAHGIVITDRSGAIVWANPAFTEITGYRREEVLGENPSILKSGEQDDAFYEDIWSTILAGETWRGELVNRRKDGSLYRERQSVVPVRHRGDEITHFVAVKEDVSREKEREEELRQTTRRLHELLDTAAGIIFRVDLSDLGVTYVTPNVASLTGHPVERWTEEPRFWMEAVPDEDLERVLGSIASAVRSGQRQAEEEYRIRHADGSLHWYRSIVRFESDEDGEPVAFVGTSVDVTERRKLEGQLRHQALHDPLTGLANRHLLADRLDQAVGRARRHDEGMAVLILDVDRFKRINDSLGHTAGDRVLEEVARRLEESVRHEDTVARFGGDEFCLLLTELGSGDELGRVRDRLLDRLREPMEVTGQELSLDVTLGGVVFGSSRLPGAVSVEDPAELIRYADRALHRAKRRVGTSQHLYDPNGDGREAGDPLEREQDLRRGLEAREFEPHYQPIVRLATGEIWGVEPLARWRHPDRGLVWPDEFVGLAEETGLIHELGEQVLGRAIEDLGRWTDGPADPSLRLTPNVSGRQFEEEGLTERLRAALEVADVGAERVLLEVTETSIMRATRRIDEIRDLGAGVMIDDFGTGYSSLLYLRDLNVDGLKIDMSFVQGLGRGRGNTAIVQTVLTLGKAMGLAVIAEGIETAGQLRRLREMGCELGQGYLFARPVPAGEMEALLAEGPLATAGSR